MKVMLRGGKMKVILICGKAGSGKNQFADFVKEYLDVDTNGEYLEKTLIRNNAQSVKDMAIEQYNWNGEKDAKGRQLLIDITNKGYDTDIYYWEKATVFEAVTHSVFYNPHCEYLIIPDWRYSQTLDYFKRVAEEVITVRIERPNSTKGTHDTHSSENDFMNFDVDMQVINDKDLDNLKKVAKQFVQRRCN